MTPRRRTFPGTWFLLSALLGSCTGVQGPGPSDTAGSQSVHPVGSTKAGYGYWAFLPSGYDWTPGTFPLLVFLHGSGESGDGSRSALDLVVRNGPPMLIAKRKWNPVRPMVVVSPQSPGSWDPRTLHAFLVYLATAYRIDRSRIYLTGLSMGGYGTYNYLTTLGPDGWVAAAVPICGQGNTAQAPRVAVPLWAFHGDSDTTVPIGPDLAMVAAINAASPRVRAKITVYPGVDHDSWTRTYDGTGRGTGTADSAPYDQDLWAWMLRYSKP